MHLKFSGGGDSMFRIATVHFLYGCNEIKKSWNGVIQTIQTIVHINGEGENLCSISYLLNLHFSPFIIWCLTASMNGIACNNLNIHKTDINVSC